MAAEYEVNIKINTDKVVTDLGKVDKTIKNLGKSATSQEKSLERIVDKRARLMNRINELESKGLSVSKLRKQMGKATTEQGRRDLVNAEREFRILERSIRLEQSKLRILKAQREGFPASPIRGIRTMMGSPAQIAASGRQAVSPIGGRLDIAGSPAQMQAIEKLERAEIRAAKNAHMAKLRLVQKRQKVRLDNVDKLLAKDIKALESFDKRLKAADDARAKRLAGAPVPGLEGRLFGPAMAPVQGPRQMIASPIGGSRDIKGSPAFIQRKENIRRLEQVGLGAGFPLLFGGGPGAVLGGAAGGLTGSFGAQIAFSALGQQIDRFIASVASVGTALTSASGTVEMFREKNLFSSDAVKEHAFQLEQQGELQKLATLLTRDLASQIGVNAVKNFQELGGELKEFLGTINKLFLAVQGFVAGPLAGLLGAINTVLGGVSTEMQFRSLRSSLSGAALAEFENVVAETAGTRKMTGRERQKALRRGEAVGPVANEITSAVRAEVLKDPRIAKLRQTIDITGQTNLEDTLGGAPGARAAERLLESSQKRIALLKLEASEIKQITEFKNKIAAAELVGDKRTVARLSMERELAKVKSTQDKAIARINEKLPEGQQLLERQGIEAKALAQAAEVRAQFERDIAVIVRDEQNEAIKNQFELASKLAKSREEAVKREERLYKQLGDTVQSGLVDGIKSAIEGSKTLGEVLGNVFSRLSDQFLDFAANLAFYGNTQGTFQQGSGLIGSLFSAFSPSAGITGPITGVAQSSFNATSLFTGAAIPFASGGYISNPTRALVGEGGQGEYVIPESKMRESMARYSRGARGASVIPESGEAGTVGGGGGTAVAASIDVRYTVERINDVEYVTAAQFQAGMQQAAAQGAQRGEQQTLRRLQMSGSTRRRIGL